MTQLFKSLATLLAQQRKTDAQATSIRTLDSKALSQVGGGGPVGSWK
jgi:hypothetical protein